MPSRKPPTEFKRGLPKLTRREQQAVPTGDLVAPVVLPEEQLATILRAHGITLVDAAPLHAILAEMVSLWRDMENGGIVRLSPQEEVTQAHVIAELSRELAERLQYIAPNVWAAAEAAHWEAHRRLLEPVTHHTMPALNVLTDTFESAAAHLAAQAPRTGPIANPARAMALRVVVATLARHSNPPVRAARLREVAAELLGACGMPMPNAPHELRKLENSR